MLDLARVAVDAMGGDRAPDEVVAGALEARSEEIEPVLFGRRSVLEPLASGLEIVDAPDVVAMDEKPADAARERRESSMFTACRAVGERRADAVALSLPDKILCRDDCAGLCPVCGRDLNAEPHEHENEAVDSRWAVLGELKDRL